MLSFMNLFNTPTFKYEPQCRHLDRNKMSQAKKDKFIQQGRNLRAKYGPISDAHIYCPYTQNSREEYFWLKAFGI